MIHHMMTYDMLTLNNICHIMTTIVGRIQHMTTNWKLIMSSDEQYPVKTSIAARRVGVSSRTLLRWFKEEKVKEVRRDRNNHRIYYKDDIEALIKYAKKTIPPT